MGVGVKQSISLRIILFILVLMTAVPHLCYSITVAKSGGDYFSIQDALDNAGPGDTIYVKAGTYREKLEFTNGGSSSGGYIVLRNFDNDRVVLDGRDIDGIHMIYAENKSYIIIQGLEIMNNLGVRDGSGIRIEGYGSNIEIRNNRIHDILGRNAMGITVYGTSKRLLENVIIDANEIYNCEPAESEALVLNGNVRNFEVTNNVVHDVNNIAIDFIGGESWIDSAAVESGVCRGNVVYRARSSYGGGYAAGITVDGARNIIVEENVVYDSDMGIEVGAENRGVTATGIVVRRNILYNNDKAGLVFGGYSKKRGRVQNCRFYNNVLYRNQVGRDGTGELWIQYASDNEVKNNIIVAGKQGVLYTSGKGDVNNIIDFNCYFLSEPERSGESPFYVNDTNYATFNDYTRSTSNDKHSIFRNPHFTDESRFDFSLKPASPCIDNGTDVGLAFSGPAPDMGAMEMGGRAEIAKETRPEVKTESEVDGEGRKGLGLVKIELDNVFPVLFKYYDDHPIGRAVIINWEDQKAEDIRVSLFVRQYMDVPKEGLAPDMLEAGGEGAVELTALFTEKVLGITEGTKVTAEITLEYTIRGRRHKNEYRETVRLYDRNASTWDDDRKAAAFVTSKDPLVLRFSKNVISMTREKQSGDLNRNLLHSVALFEALSLYGMSYVIDPTTPYIEFSENKQSVDFLQFPRQTLEYRAGDCDDLSIMYAALLESVGVETAFVTIPGHMLMAFSMDMKPDEARKVLLKADDLIFRNENTWIPVEVTELGGGFFAAWQTGSREWREAAAAKKEGFYPVHDAWKTYEPVGLPGTTGGVQLPSRQRVWDVFEKEVNKFIESIIHPQTMKIQADIKRSGGGLKYVNRLGVLYARYGLMEEAEMEFRKALAEDGAYLPALMNLGNIFFTQKDLPRALEYYEKAADAAHENPRVILSLARTHHAMENYGFALRFHDKLLELDPDLAVQFSYLGLKGEEAKRNAEMAGLTGTVIWEEDAD
jgi:tetratricopeptide (TPR) repeat protein